MSLVSLAIATAGGITPSQGEPPEARFEKKCSVCHSTHRPLAKTKSRAGWESTVKRMQGKNPRLLPDEELEGIVRYLTETRGR